jgi:hypothetical protein
LSRCGGYDGAGPGCDELDGRVAFGDLAADGGDVISASSFSALILLGVGFGGGFIEPGCVDVLLELGVILSIPFFLLLSCFCGLAIGPAVVPTR